MKKALVAGGAGFLGSHLCEALLGRGYQVICLDNLITGNKKNLASFEKNPNFRFIKKDIYQDNISVRKLNYIFHLASPASPIDYQKHPEETALTNSLGTYRLLRLAARTKARFLLASTSEIYGDPLEHPQKETYRGNSNTFGPRANYDGSKRFGETLVYIFLKKYNLNARVIRIFNTYGPRMQKWDGRVISNFINQALEGKPLTIYGKGDQTRSFCFVSDLVEGIQRAMFYPNTKGEIFNLGNPDEYTINSIAQVIKTKVNPDSTIVYQDLPDDDPTKRRPDITKAKKVLKWQAKVSLEEGLQKTIDYYRSL